MKNLFPVIFANYNNNNKMCSYLFGNSSIILNLWVVFLLVKEFSFKVCTSGVVYCDIWCSVSISLSSDELSELEYETGNIAKS